jgi:hypothetical protein
MSNSALVIGVVVVAIFVVIAIALIVKSQRSQRLKSRFGPEYNRAVEETGSKTQAEAKLEKLAKRVRSFKINELSPTARADSISAWQKIQGRFVDDPKSALAEADTLIQKIMMARGYPVTEFEQRAADLSVDHPLIVEHYRAGHDIAVRHAQGQASTEDMRQAMIHYRTLFAELAGEPDLTRSTAAGGANA